MLNIYDFDNTLVYTKDCLYYAYKRAVIDVTGRDLLTEEDMLNNEGNSIVELFARYGISQRNWDLIKKRKNKIYPQYFKYMIPNTELINEIKENEINVVCSNSEQYMIEKILRYFNILNKFDKIVGRDTYPNTECKPSPSMFIKLIDEYDTENNIMIYDDSEFGIEGAERTVDYYRQFNLQLPHRIKYDDFKIKNINITKISMYI